MENANQMKPLHTSDSNTGCFIQRYLNGESRLKQPDILFGRTGQELPCLRLCSLQSEIIATHTGPDGGLTTVNRGQRGHVTSQDPDVSYIDSEDDAVPLPSTISSESTSNDVNATVQPEVSDEHLADHEELPTKEPTPAAEPPEPEIEIAGVVNWNRPSGIAFGAATSLYERHPISGETAGNPLADAFAIVTRSNNALLCLADGVNWGERAALAARSAIHGAMDYLNRALFPSTTNGRQLTTNDVFLSLLRSFHAAHSMILQEGGLLTTLTAAVVAQLDQSSLQNSLYTGSDNSNSAKFVVCVCNVGDSLAYVYSPKHGVREITHGSHDIQSMRDMRDALGALGPVDGQNPELNNLTCSMTVIEEGDIVFLTSDGVSDNFDPVVGKFVVARKPDKIVPLPNSAKQTTKPPNRNLPTVEAFQRHELTLLRMEDILRNGMMPTNDNGNHLKAQQLCEDLVDFATRLTTAKRRLLEDLELYVDQDGKPLDPEEQKIRRRKICERLALIPGKLDHATCVAYEARIQPPNPVNIAGTEALTREMVASYPFRESSI